MLDDIAAHADALPDVPELQKLKSTAKKFTEAVRESQAPANMAAAQQNLLSSNFPGAIDDAERQPTSSKASSASAKAWAMARASRAKWRSILPPVVPSWATRIEQMLAMMGMKPGSGSRAASPAWALASVRAADIRSAQPGPQNVGMYGSLPMPSSRASQGRGNRQSQGMATNSSNSPQQAGAGDGTATGQGNAAGQAESNVPAQYRTQVPKYFQQLSEKLGDQQ